MAQLGGHPLSPLSTFYLATLGGARALYLDERIGNFAPGKEGDFVVLDPAATPLLERRMRHADSWSDRLFVLYDAGRRSRDRGHASDGETPAGLTPDVPGTESGTIVLA